MKRKLIITTIGRREDGVRLVKKPNGDTEYWLRGKKHREDGGPAVLRNNGNREWWVDGKLLRIITRDGIIQWYKNGQLHRDNGPAIEIPKSEWGKRYEWGEKRYEWFINGRRHRIDGPAVESESGYKEWWVNGKRHRIGGPAIEYPKRFPEDLEIKQWFLSGVEYSEKGYWIELSKKGYNVAGNANAITSLI